MIPITIEMKQTNQRGDQEFDKDIKS